MGRGEPHSTMPSSTTPSMAIVRIARALTWLIYAFVIVVLIILTLGFFLLLFGANPQADFAEWVYRSLNRVMAPFRGIFEPVPLDGHSVLDTSVLFAMIIYSIAAMLLHALITWLTDRLYYARVRHGASAYAGEPYG
jgi:uncharacterized protein YggT (Ycf19 family)